MEARCDYCRTEQTLVFCKSDSAKLCFNCDVFIHSANPLSLKHTRSLLCNKCYSQPALIHCLNEKLSLCQMCNNCSGLGHRVQTLSSYSGSNWDFGFDKIKELDDDDWDGLFTSIQTQNSSFISMESNLPKIIENGCSSLDLCEEMINLDDAPLDFNASDDIMGCSSLDHTLCYQYYSDNSFKEENKKNIGLNSMFLPTLEDSPWESNVEGSFSPKSRDEAKKRYNQKKSKRTFGKQIRYASRKARADTRKRVKGRFVKA